MSTEQLPDGLQLAVNELLKLAESNRNMGPLDQGSFFDRRALEMSASADAIRAEHAQRVTMQHHSADLAQQIEDLRFAAESGGQRIAELEAVSDELRARLAEMTTKEFDLAAERDALRAKLVAIEAQEPVAWMEQEWSGSGERRLHFARRPKTIRDEVTHPVWTALYARPVPAQAVPDGWRPMHSAPRDGTAVLALLDGSDVAHAVRWLPNGNKSSGSAGWHVVWDLSAVAQYDGPTHWMPIPDAPEHKA